MIQKNTINEAHHQNMKLSALIAITRHIHQNLLRRQTHYIRYQGYRLISSLQLRQSLPDCVVLMSKAINWIKTLSSANEWQVMIDPVEGCWLAAPTLSHKKNILVAKLVGKLERLMHKCKEWFLEFCLRILFYTYFLHFYYWFDLISIQINA